MIPLWLLDLGNNTTSNTTSSDPILGVPWPVWALFLGGFALAMWYARPRKPKALRTDSEGRYDWEREPPRARKKPKE